jgi:hypothetical protein
MERFEQKITINYYWESVDVQEIPKEHKEFLQADALERIFMMIEEGYNSGELHTSVRLGKDVVSQEDEQDGLSYYGWWDISYEN